MLKVDKVTKKFGDVVAVSDVSFDVSPGDFLFITGPSGSGKTTVLKMILRDYVPDEGKIIYKKKDLSTLAEEDLPHHRQKIGVVFQDFKVLNERTLRENVEVALAVVGTPESEWKKRVNNVLDLVGLVERSELFPSQLSGGELQRVALARALVTNPDLILADEPTGNLDWELAFGIVDLLDKINKEGKTIIMATHHQGIVEKMKKNKVELKKAEKKEKKKEK